MNIVQSAKRRVRSKAYGLTALIFKSPFSFVKILRYYTNKEFYLALQRPLPSAVTSLKVRDIVGGEQTVGIGPV